MRVTLPVGIATGGGTSKFRELFVEPGTTATRLFRKNNQAAIDTPWSDAPAELAISGEGGAGDPQDPRLDWFSSTQVDADLFDIVRNVTGPLTYSFSFYEIMPQVGQPQPTIERGAINAAYPGGTAAPDPKPRHAPRSRPTTSRTTSRSARSTTATRSRRPSTTRRPPTSSSRSTTTSRIPTSSTCRRSRRSPTARSALTGLAAALGNYTPYIAPNNDARGIAPGFLIKDGTTATNGGVDAAALAANGPWTSSGSVRPLPGQAVRPRAVHARHQEGRPQPHRAEQPLRIAVAPGRLPDLGGRLRPAGSRATCSSRAATCSWRVT